nr:hypothetical protein [Candidatus Freyarchaeota archaeon]
MSVTPSCPQMEQTLIGLLKIKTGDKLEWKIVKRKEVLLIDCTNAIKAYPGMTP